MFPLSGPSAPSTKRSTPSTHLATVLKSDIVLTKGQTPTSGSGAPLTTSVPPLTPGPLTMGRLLPSVASGTFRLSSVSGYSFTGPGPSSTGPRRTTKSQIEMASPRHADLVPTSTHTGHQSMGSPTVEMCHTSTSLLGTLPPIRYSRVVGGVPLS